jgi:hypothetical protein
MNPLEFLDRLCKKKTTNNLQRIEKMIEIIKCPYCKNKQSYEHNDAFQLCEECKHYFVADMTITARKVGPDKCKCNPEYWGTNAIPPACSMFIGNDDAESICDICGHDRECHK